MMTYLKKPLACALAVVFAAGLTACGGDSDKKSATTQTLSGTAAKGAPIVGTVFATGANGVDSSSVTINADGSYTLNITGLTAPYIVVAEEDGTSELYYSYADAPNVVVNITPLTTAALAMSADGDPADLLDNWQANHGEVTETEITQAAQQVYANLQTQFQANGVTPNHFNFFREPFDADSSGLDAVLDEIQDVSYDFTAPTPVITIQPVTGSPLAINPGIAIDGIDFVDGDGVLGNDDKCITADANLSADTDHDGCDDANEDTDDDNDGSGYIGSLRYRRFSLEC